MLHFDMTQTRLFVHDAATPLPTDAELFTLTAALLLLCGKPFSDLSYDQLELHTQNIEDVAQCIEYRLAALTPDIGRGADLRTRLRQLAGLRIASAMPIRPRRRSDSA